MSVSVCLRGTVIVLRDRRHECECEFVDVLTWMDLLLVYPLSYGYI